MPRRHYSPAAPLLPLPFLIILFSTVALILLLSLLSLSSHILRPISVKTGWDSLNVLLVLFAVLCGIFARRTEDERIADEGNTTTSYTVDQKTSRNAVSNEWIDDRYDSTTPSSGTGRLKRNSSSYRDLRQYSVGETGDNQFMRFFDDFDMSKYRSAEADILNFHGHRRQESEIQDEPKEIPVDTFVVCSSFSPPTPPKSQALEPPPLPPPPPARHHKARRAYRPVGHRRKVENTSDQCDTGFEETKSPPPAPPPPPPPRPRPSPSAATVETEQQYSKSGRKMSNARKEIKMALASLYSRRKMLKGKNPPDDYFDHASEEPVYSTRPPPTPPPPPPPPPPSVFHNLFKKGIKSKRNNSWSGPPLPPPTPPRSSKPKKNQTRTPTPKAPPTPPPQSTRRRPAGTTGRPPLPTRTDQFYDETTNNGGKSPLFRMPSPPPPFETLKTKFVIRGDYVRIRSTHNSRCSSPELEDLYVSSSKGNPDTANKMDGEDRVTRSAFCPSPDVNVKADAFIARLRDGWRLEKMKSVKDNGNLARGPGPSPSMRW